MIEGIVSTIIPVFNRAVLLREAVDSVLAQTWRPIEIVIVDDGSTDDTVDVARGLRSLHPTVIQILTQNNAGPGVARQTGLAAARGEFIQFLDSDDLLLPDKFSLQVAGLRADQEAGICYAKTYTRNNDARAAQPAQRSAEQHRTVFPALLVGRLWETSTPLYRRSALEQIGPWPRKRQMEDWEFDAQAGAAGIKLHYCDTFLAEYRIHGGHRLAHAWVTDLQALRDRVLAHQAIYRLAKQAKVADESPEMKQYARTLFWMARTAGARGLTAEASDLLDLVHRMAKGNSAAATQITLYRLFTQLLGWKAMGRLSRWFESIRPAPRQ